MRVQYWICLFFLLLIVIDVAIASDKWNRRSRKKKQRASKNNNNNSKNNNKGSKNNNKSSTPKAVGTKDDLSTPPPSKINSEKSKSSTPKPISKENISSQSPSQSGGVVGRLLKFGSSALNLLSSSIAPSPRDDEPSLLEQSPETDSRKKSHSSSPAISKKKQEKEKEKETKSHGKAIKEESEDIPLPLNEELDTATPTEEHQPTSEGLDIMKLGETSQDPMKESELETPKGKKKASQKGVSNPKKSKKKSDNRNEGSSPKSEPSLSEQSPETDSREESHSSSPVTPKKKQEKETKKEKETKIHDEAIKEESEGIPPSLDKSLDTAALTEVDQPTSEDLGILKLSETSQDPMMESDLEKPKEKSGKGKKKVLQKNVSTPKNSKTDNGNKGKSSKNESGSETSNPKSNRWRRKDTSSKKRVSKTKPIKDQEKSSSPKTQEPDNISKDGEAEKKASDEEHIALASDDASLPLTTPQSSSTTQISPISGAVGPQEKTIEKEEEINSSAPQSTVSTIETDTDEASLSSSLSTTSSPSSPSVSTTSHSSQPLSSVPTRSSPELDSSSVINKGIEFEDEGHSSASGTIDQTTKADTDEQTKEQDIKRNQNESETLNQTPPSPRFEAHASPAPDTIETSKETIEEEENHETNPNKTPLSGDFSTTSPLTSPSVTTVFHFSQPLSPVYTDASEFNPLSAAGTSVLGKDTFEGQGESNTRGTDAQVTEDGTDGQVKKQGNDQNQSPTDSEIELKKIASMPDKRETQKEINEDEENTKDSLRSKASATISSIETDLDETSLGATSSTTSFPSSPSTSTTFRSSLPSSPVPRSTLELNILSGADTDALGQDATFENRGGSNPNGITNQATEADTDKSVEEEEDSEKNESELKISDQIDQSFESAVPVSPISDTTEVSKEIAEEEENPETNPNKAPLSGDFSATSPSSSPSVTMISHPSQPSSPVPPEPFEFDPSSAAGRNVIEKNTTFENDESSAIGIDTRATETMTTEQDKKLIQSKTDITGGEPQDPSTSVQRPITFTETEDQEKSTEVENKAQDSNLELEVDIETQTPRTDLNSKTESIAKSPVPEGTEIIEGIEDMLKVPLKGEGTTDEAPKESETKTNKSEILKPSDETSSFREAHTSVTDLISGNATTQDTIEDPQIKSHRVEESETPDYQIIMETDKPKEKRDDNTSAQKPHSDSTELSVQPSTIIEENITMGNSRQSSQVVVVDSSPPIEQSPSSDALVSQDSNNEIDRKKASEGEDLDKDDSEKSHESHIHITKVTDNFPGYVDKTITEAEKQTRDSVVEPSTDKVITLSTSLSRSSQVKTEAITGTQLMDETPLPSLEEVNTRTVSTKDSVRKSPRESGSIASLSLSETELKSSTASENPSSTPPGKKKSSRNTKFPSPQNIPLVTSVVDFSGHRKATRLNIRRSDPVPTGKNSGSGNSSTKKSKPQSSEPREDLFTKFFIHFISARLNLNPRQDSEKFLSSFVTDFIEKYEALKGSSDGAKPTLDLVVDTLSAITENGGKAKPETWKSKLRVTISNLVKEKQLEATLGPKIVNQLVKAKVITGPSEELSSIEMRNFVNEKLAAIAEYDTQKKWPGILADLKREGAVFEAPLESSTSSKTFAQPSPSFEEEGIIEKFIKIVDSLGGDQWSMGGSIKGLVDRSAQVEELADTQKKIVFNFEKLGSDDAGAFLYILCNLQRQVKTPRITGSEDAQASSLSTSQLERETKIHSALSLLSSKTLAEIAQNTERLYFTDASPSSGSGTSSSISRGSIASSATEDTTSSLTQEVDFSSPKTNVVEDEPMLHSSTSPEKPLVIHEDSTPPPSKKSPIVIIIKNSQNPSSMPNQGSKQSTKLSLHGANLPDLPPNIKEMMSGSGVNFKRTLSDSIVGQISGSDGTPIIRKDRGEPTTKPRPMARTSSQGGKSVNGATMNADNIFEGERKRSMNVVLSSDLSPKSKTESSNPAKDLGKIEESSEADHKEEDSRTIIPKKTLSTKRKHKKSKKETEKTEKTPSSTTPKKDSESRLVIILDKEKDLNKLKTDDTEKRKEEVVKEEDEEEVVKEEEEEEMVKKEDEEAIEDSSGDGKGLKAPNTDSWTKTGKWIVLFGGAVGTGGAYMWLNNMNLVGVQSIADTASVDEASDWQNSWSWRTLPYPIFFMIFTICAFEYLSD